MDTKKLESVFVNAMALFIIVSFAFILLRSPAGELPDEDESLGTVQNETGKEWLVPKDAAKERNPVLSSAESIKRGNDLFLLNCVSCHGINAEGDGAAAKAFTIKPANLRQMAGTHSDAEFAWKIDNGKGEMPAWKNILSENEIWDIVNYIQSLSASGEVQHSENH